MRRAMTALVVLVAATTTLASVASARPAAANQRVSIDQKGGSFVLTAASSGAIKDDKGALTACCWTSRHVTVAGQRLEVDNPRLTLTGANGTLNFRNRIEWVDVPGGLGILNGTWKVVGGTGAYAGMSGHGRVEGVQTKGGYGRVHFFGFLTSG